MSIPRRSRSSSVLRSRWNILRQNSNYNFNARKFNWNLFNLNLFKLFPQAWVIPLYLRFMLYLDPELVELVSLTLSMSYSRLPKSYRYVRWVIPTLQWAIPALQWAIPGLQWAFPALSELFPPSTHNIIKHQKSMFFSTSTLKQQHTVTWVTVVFLQGWTLFIGIGEHR
jgi:hypothetical protein